VLVASQTFDPIDRAFGSSVPGPSPAAHLTMRVDLSPRKSGARLRKRLRSNFRSTNFKQPHFRVLAAQCVRGLLFPSRDLREGMERWEAPGHQWAPLEAGLTYPPRTARHRARPRLGAAPPSAPPTTGAVDRPGAPVRPAFALSAEGSLLESGPLSDRTRNIYSKLGIPSIGIFRFRKNIFAL
jgi:hypothetical protein